MENEESRSREPSQTLVPMSLQHADILSSRLEEWPGRLHALTHLGKRAGRDTAVAGHSVWVCTSASSARTLRFSHPLGAKVLGSGLALRDEGKPDPVTPYLRRSKVGKDLLRPRRDLRPVDGCGHSATRSRTPIHHKHSTHPRACERSGRTMVFTKEGHAPPPRQGSQDPPRRRRLDSVPRLRPPEWRPWLGWALSSDNTARYLAQPIGVHVYEAFDRLIGELCRIIEDRHREIMPLGLMCHRG